MDTPSPQGGGRDKEFPQDGGRFLEGRFLGNAFPAASLFGVIELDTALAEELADLVRAGEVAGGPSGSAQFDKAGDVGVVERPPEFDYVQDSIGVAPHPPGASPLG